MKLKDTVVYDEVDDKQVKKIKKRKKTQLESTLDLLIEQNELRNYLGLSEIEIGKERNCTKCDISFISLKGERNCGCVKSKYATTLNGSHII